MNERLIQLLKLEYEDHLAAEEREKQARIEDAKRAWREETKKIWLDHGESKFRDVIGINNFTMIPYSEQDGYMRGRIDAEGLTFTWDWFGLQVRFYLVDKQGGTHMISTRRQLAYHAYQGRLD